ncbi:MAG: hypothetical protein CBC42_03720 [Betaproteobacteria bacterium TMED82]|nr:MAG: hypothetical protein CBC42_03720 [Betaproteobacteria bacterium TMED82]|tara:strand:- start:15754 stop:16821 length:1068 start_codon:yes stop_codon:yes gene_type:complete
MENNQSRMATSIIHNKKFMHNSLKGFFCFTLLVLCSLEAREKPKLSSEFYARLSAGVVKILAPAEGKLYAGSGVVVGEGEVLTNCHVVRYSSRITVMKGALRFPVTSQKVDVYKDLCLLDVPSLKLPPVEIRDPEEMQVGNFAYFYGYPGGADAFFTEGRVSGFHPINGSAIVKTTAGFSSGGSGGGLFDSNGRLIGITTFFSAGHSGGYYALPSSWIESLRDQKPEVITKLEGLTLWEMGPKNQPNFLKFSRLAEKQDWDGAHAVSKIWIEAESDNFDAWLSHGVTLMNLGVDEEAMVSFNKALLLAPDNANVLFAIQELSRKTGDSFLLESVSAKLNAIDPEGVSAGKCNMSC